ncbi:hypothetical protein PO587_20655 [Streptomyces gilvifuscus]|uniref:Uncharacterized protein n=1 Tax=Streptomyces gilvifuscus TaxID=1550617 RepID=A0ABT5FWF2_9ACTN|nr:hypothetical protein [Streptomyces gilvifuscus]MDC2956879.1 hypothetical protein [Streptomyces gilvifuscus]
MAALFYSSVMVGVALTAFAVLREHGTRLTKAASWLCLAIAALPGLALVGIVLQVIFGS